LSKLGEDVGEAVETLNLNKAMKALKQSESIPN